MAVADSEIISEYHEQIRGILDRRLTLFSDSVRVVGNVRGTRGEGTVMLSGLQPAPHKAWIRSKHFHWASATLFILTPFVLVPFVVYPPNFVVLTIGLMFYLPAIWYFVQSLQRKEVAIFMNRSGVVGLDFWCNGPDTERFPEFVGAVERQIREQSVHRERS